MFSCARGARKLASWHFHLKGSPISLPLGRARLLHATPSPWQTKPLLWGSQYYEDQSYGQDSVLETDISNATLLRLVARRQFAAAERVRLHLLDQGQSIQPHPSYERAAIEKLRVDSADFVGFSAWLSYTPDKHEYPAADRRYRSFTETQPRRLLTESRQAQLENGTLRRPFSETRSALLEGGTPPRKFAMIYHFGTIIAGKGYHQIVYKDIIPFVVRFASPSSGEKFLLDFEDAALRYEQRVYPKTLELRAAQLRDSIIRLCCHAGWLDEATRVLQQSQHINIPTETCVLLLKKLQAKIDEENVRLVRKVGFSRRAALPPCE